jgi:hypothetical protein
VETRVLFSGDLFGGLSRAPGLFCREEDWPGIDLFHQLYMPAGKALANAVASIRRLSPGPVLIAPQHGGIVPEADIERLLKRIERLPVGLDLLVDAKERAHYVHAANDIVQGLTTILGTEKTTTGLRRFAADGTFPNLFVFAGEREITDVKVEPRAAIAALVRDVLAAAGPEQRRAIDEIVEETLRRHGVSLTVAPEDATA